MRWANCKQFIHRRDLFALSSADDEETEKSWNLCWLWMGRWCWCGVNELKRIWIISLFFLFHLNLQYPSYIASSSTSLFQRWRWWCLELLWGKKEKDGIWNSCVWERLRTGWDEALLFSELAETNNISLSFLYFYYIPDIFNSTLISIALNHFFQFSVLAAMKGVSSLTTYDEDMYRRRSSREKKMRKVEEIECEFDSIFMICLTINSNPGNFLIAMESEDKHFEKSGGVLCTKELVMWSYEASKFPQD